MKITTYNDKGIQVGTVKNWSQIKVGNQKITIYKGWEQLYPDPNALPIGLASIGSSLIVGGDST